MIYEMRYYTSKSAWEAENESYVMIWENKDKTPTTNCTIGGKLIKCIGYPNKKFEIPEGIETIGKEVLVNPDWDIFDTAVKEVIIPKSVEKIEEGAFNWTNINKISVHPDSPCAIVKNGGLYAKDGSTLLFAFKANVNKVFVVEDGTKRIGLCALENPHVLGVHQEPDGPILTTAVIPASVEQIAFDEENDWAYDCVVIKAPKGSYAIKFAKKHKIRYIEI
jgi:hypothetical protein